MIISGTIVDQETADPTPYAQVYLMKRPAGTLSNLEGNFQIEVSDRDATDTLMFSYLGYSKIKIPVSRYIASQIRTVQMNAETFALQELVIRPKTAREYVEQAVRNTPKHYKTHDYNSTLFSREVGRINGEYLRLNESILKGYFSPIVGGGDDTSRISVLGFREFENKALLERGRGNLEEKKALYESLINLFVDFSPYVLWDSTFTRAWYEDEKRFDKVHFEHGQVLKDGKSNVDHYDA